MLPRRYLPSIASLTALEALERLGTASAAAAELSLTQGAVSRQIQLLEGQLGAPLVTRERQRLVLTPAARDYVAEVRKAMKLLSDASLTLRANPSGGTLHLSILPAFGMHWLAPRLAGFAAGHPEVTVNLSTRLRPFDFDGTSFDAAIHYGREDWPGVNYMKLMEEEVIALAAPSLITRPLTGAADLLALPLLQLESRMGDWGRWFGCHDLPGQRPPAMLFDQFATMAQAAVHGMGVALLPTFLAAGDLAAGRLVPAWGGPVAASGAYYLVWPATRAERAPLTSFRRWLAAGGGTGEGPGAAGDATDIR
ncbi:LysR family transcriptional regulator [Pseudomonas sp. GX19020]|uniref:LysR family transcriptional regulator n=1 Tax=Pseudomonas sp. GX19020 TaxID=2942277 RepID=UPI00201930FA|nr:LysR family transcriptional regulator [Pseudomonas sp. GX19020]MCL4067344.1 LysR family transcriptional regulator [Pseudomonas sp. GX19020]